MVDLATAVLEETVIGAVEAVGTMVAVVVRAIALVEEEAPAILEVHH